MNTIISQHRGELQESTRWRSFKVHVKCVLKVRHTWPNIWCFECSTGWLKISQSKEQRFILYHKIQADRWQTYVNSRVSVIAVLKITPASPGEVIPEKLGQGVRPASQSPYPIYDQNLRYFLPYLWPNQKLYVLFITIAAGIVAQYIIYKGLCWLSYR